MNAIECEMRVDMHESHCDIVNMMSLEGCDTCGSSGGRLVANI